MARDRKDAKRVDIPGLMQCCIDLKPARKENEVYINRQMDVTALAAYLDTQKAAGNHLTYFHAFLAAIGKTLYNRPKLNRFIKNRHLYERNNVVVSFVAKMTLTDKSEEIMLVVPIEPEDTIHTLAAKTAAKVDNLRAKGAEVEKAGANSAIDVLGKLPNPIRVPIFGIIKFLDNHGWVPAALANDNLYYSSMIMSNLGSFRCGAIYHNLADFGTASSLATMGEIAPTTIIGADGTTEERLLCEFGITLDERIGDGYYFSKSCKLVEYLLQHPEMLEEPAGTPVDMGELR